MDRTNHYEAAFEAYLRERRLCYIAIDESRRSLLADEPVKSLDFIVCGAHGGKLLVDVKGRRFPGGTPERPRRVWECWAEQADVDGLVRWELQLGAGHTGLLVFAYELVPPCEFPGDAVDLWDWRGRRYLLRAVPVDLYRRHVRVRSPRWNTVDLPGPTFRQLVRPFCMYTHVGAASRAEVSKSETISNPQ